MNCDHCGRKHYTGGKRYVEPSECALEKGTSCEAFLHGVEVGKRARPPTTLTLAQHDALTSLVRAGIEHATGGGRFLATDTAAREIETSLQVLRLLDPKAGR